VAAVGVGPGEGAFGGAELVAGAALEAQLAVLAPVVLEDVDPARLGGLTEPVPFRVALAPGEYAQIAVLIYTVAVVAATLAIRRTLSSRTSDNLTHV
jgi:hypothetical protein